MRVTLQQAGKRINESCSERVARRWLIAGCGRQIDSPTRPRTRAAGQLGRRGDVHADADDRMTRPVTLRSQLDKYSAELLAVEQQVVWPLDLDRQARQLDQCTPRNHAGSKCKGGKILGLRLELPADGQAQPAAERREPRAAAPAASAGLILGQAHAERLPGAGLDLASRKLFVESTSSRTSICSSARRTGLASLAETSFASSRSMRRPSR
jgi:hypothetical protein